MALAGGAVPCFWMWLQGDKLIIAYFGFANGSVVIDDVAEAYRRLVAGEKVFMHRYGNNLGRLEELLSKGQEDVTTIPDDFIAAFNFIQESAHNTAVQKGWWEEDRNNAEMIALTHSELSEALEYLRKGNPPAEHIPAFNGIEEEFADVVIRLMDYSAARGLRLAEAIIAKMEFNANRPHKHGKKF